MTKSSLFNQSRQLLRVHKYNITGEYLESENVKEGVGLGTRRPGVYIYPNTGRVEKGGEGVLRAYST